jgi:hypothetical protein
MPIDRNGILQAAKRCADLASTLLTADVNGDAAPTQLRERFHEARQALLERCLEEQASIADLDVQAVRKTPRLVIEAAWNAGAMYEWALHCKTLHERGSALSTNTPAKPQFTH